MPAPQVTVNHDLCEGNMVCEANAPTVFQVGDDDLARVLVDEVSDSDRDGVERAIRLCPKQAIAMRKA
jgi:ferredoxin